MKPIEFDWKEGTTSVTWESPNCGIVRFHEPGDTDDQPKYRGVVFVKVDSRWTWLEKVIWVLQQINLGKYYEFKAMVMRDGQPVTKKEHFAVKVTYLEGMLNLLGKSRRLKNGKVIVKKYPAILPKQTVEK